MQLANRESQRFNHEYIGTEHILLGLIQVPGVATDALHNLDIDLHRIRLELEKLIQSGPDMVTMGKLPMTPTAKRIIGYAQEESWRLKQKQVDTEHILLGILREEGGVARQILMNLGLRVEEARKEIEKVRRESNDLEQQPSVFHAQAQSVTQADEGMVELPKACPKCGHAPVLRIIWGAYYLSDKDREEIKSVHALLGSVKGDKKGPPWVCLECTPKWSEVHQLAMQDHELQFVKEKAIELQDFDEAARCLRSQEELRRQLAMLYREGDIWTKEQYEKFVRDSYEYLNRMQNAAKRDFALGSYERFEWDQANGTLTFSDKEVPKVIAEVEFVGSISNRTKTWLWSWDNASILPSVKEHIAEVRSFGELHGLRELTTANWEATEEDGWAMTAVTARILQAKGAYRSPSNNGFTFVVFRSLRWASEQRP